MKIKSEIIWSVMLLLTAGVFFYLGNKTGTLETEEDFSSTMDLKTEKITALERKIQQMSEELTSRGIYSYPQANLVSDKNDASATVLINLNGRDAIKDLEIVRKIKRDYSNHPEGKLQERGFKTTSSNIGDLNAHNPVTFEIQNFQNELAIDLKFKSQRNQWQQYILARKTNGKIKTFWVITNGDSQVIDKHIDEGFPTDKDGKVTLWDDREVKYSDLRMNSVFDIDPQ